MPWCTRPSRLTPGEFQLSLGTSHMDSEAAHLTLLMYEPPCAPVADEPTGIIMARTLMPQRGGALEVAAPLMRYRMRSGRVGSHAR